jgi:hypothetical protein
MLALELAELVPQDADLLFQAALDLVAAMLHIGYLLPMSLVQACLMPDVLGVCLELRSR